MSQLLTRLLRLALIGGAFLLLAAVPALSVPATAATHASPVLSARRATAPLVSMHTVNMSQVPAAKAIPAHRPTRLMPLLTGLSPAAYAQREAAAAHNKHAPVDLHPFPAGLFGGGNTPSPTVKFQGMTDSVCGCQPPDQALAASPSWVFQGVNTAFAVYNTSGALQSGWPKTAQNFFGVPNPGSCDPSGPFLSDPRAFYDPTDQRFWAAMLQVQGAFGVPCPEQTDYWIAVSQTNNPNGAWYVYEFNMALNTTNAADYTEFGFDQQAIYFSGNMFNQAGTAYEYAESFSALKSTMESGSSVTAYGFTNFMANGVLLDTVQPVENEASSFPGAGLLIDSFNMNGDGTNSCSSSCSGLVVWAIANPGTSSVSASGVVVSSQTYTFAPLADEPGCSQCIETLDTRISGTPVYQNGLISFALETGVNNGTQIVPALFWGQVQPTISNGVITGGSVFQSGYLSAKGDTAVSFGALMATSSGSLLMVADAMSSSLDPSIGYATRTTSDPLGKFEAPLLLQRGLAATFNTRWGDYEATSYDGTTGNHIWFAAQYSGSNGDWATAIGEAL
jgi:hypothetical protein